MKKSIAALALALAMLGTLAACGTDKTPGDNNANAPGSAGTDPAVSGSTAGSNGSGTSAGQVARRYDTYDNQGRDYFYDGRYTAGSNGQVYGRNGGSVSRDLTRDARDAVRDAGDAIGDIGRGIGNAARDITGMGNNAYSGAPSWEPDSSAVRY